MTLNNEEDELFLSYIYGTEIKFRIIYFSLNNIWDRNIKIILTPIVILCKLVILAFTHF